MSEHEKGAREPNLELPSLSLRRKKKRTKESEPVAEPTPEQGRTPTRSTGPSLAPVAGTAKRVPPVPPPPRRQEATAPPVAPPSEPIPAPVPPPTPEPTPEPTPQPGPAPTPVPTPGPEPVPDPTPEPAPQPVGATAVAADPVAAPDEKPSRRSRRRERRTDGERRPGVLRRLDPRVAVVLTGVVVGLVGFVLAYAGARGCAYVRGVNSCGGYGVPVLLVVLVLEVVLGAALLRAWGLTDTTGTSVLGVGIVAVLAMVFFLGALTSVWMLLVLPVLTGLSFLAAWWLSSRVVEGVPDSPR